MRERSAGGGALLLLVHSSPCSGGKRLPLRIARCWHLFFSWPPLLFLQLISVLFFFWSVLFELWIDLINVTPPCLPGFVFRFVSSGCRCCWCLFVWFCEWTRCSFFRVMSVAVLLLNFELELWASFRLLSFSHSASVPVVYVVSVVRHSKVRHRCPLSPFLVPHFKSQLSAAFDLIDQRNWQLASAFKSLWRPQRQ